MQCHRYVYIISIEYSTERIPSIHLYGRSDYLVYQKNANETLQTAQHKNPIVSFKTRSPQRKTP